MTGDEMERAMERLRQSQANFEAQAKIDFSLRDSVRDPTASQLGTDELLARLSNLVERLIREDRDGNSRQ